MKKKRTEQNEEIDDINPYQVDKLSKIPTGLILTFLKFWAAAAAVFFILVGGIDLGLNFSRPAADAYAEMARTIVGLILVSLFLAILLNYGIKHVCHLMHNRRNNAKKWMVLNIKGFLAFLAYLVYCLVTMTIVFLIVAFMGKYHLIPSLLENNGLGIEPFLTGAIFIVVDGAILFTKNMIIKLYKVLRYRRLISQD
ncbi:MAG: hypothetical protein K6B64_04700 [Acholeplasmatales bacterium]|nr:hypothetical protein [Acholeplasmatales bacterium]